MNNSSQLFQYYYQNYVRQPSTISGEATTGDQNRQPDSNSENKQDLAGKTDNTNMGQPMQYYQTPYGGYPVNQGTILLLHLNAPGPRPARLKIKFC